MTLIVGATGLLGSEICRQLGSQGNPIRTLVRDTSGAEKVAQLKALGAEVVSGDLKNPQSMRRHAAG
jgi:uncharacterized protein YbjT (DUF2867 family)